MRTQIRILGTIDILLGAYWLWTFLTVYDSIADFIQREFTLTVFLIGLIIGGVGLWGSRKAGWIANQMTGIHLILSGFISANNLCTLKMMIQIIPQGFRGGWLTKGSMVSCRSIYANTPLLLVNIQAYVKAQLVKIRSSVFITLIFN